MPDDDARMDPGKTALKLAARLRRLDPGPLAALRRMDADGAAPAYWHLAASHENLFRRPEVWVPVVRALAMLTSKGPPEERDDLHDATRRLGAALCDGGDPDWPSGGTPRPMLSERRLAQLLAARGAGRAVLLTRAVRALAAKKPAHAGVHVPDLAWAFIGTKPQKIAEPYYRRLDRAERAASKEET